MDNNGNPAIKGVSRHVYAATCAHCHGSARLCRNISGVGGVHALFCCDVRPLCATPHIHSGGDPHCDPNHILKPGLADGGQCRAVANAACHCDCSATDRSFADDATAYRDATATDAGTVTDAAESYARLMAGYSCTADSAAACKACIRSVSARNCS
jgi:hypothetical protein